MNPTNLAIEARAMVAAGTARTIAEAIQIVTRRALDQIAGTYTVQSENLWIREVTRAELTTRIPAT